jgi:hypothetical protein
MVQEIWNKLNANERLVGYGGLILVVVALIGFVLGWSSASTFALLAGIILLGILYAKYAPNMNITWPAPVALILLAVSGIALVLLLLQVLPALRFIAGVDALVILGLPLGAALATWGAWQEYQAMPKSSPATPPVDHTPPPPPSANPPG